MSPNHNPHDGQFSSTSNTFDIRNHLHKLEPGKGKDSYTCPVCEGKRLTFDKQTGAYQCWSGSCSTDDIREAIRPLADFLAERHEQQPSQLAKKPRAKKKEEYPPAPIPSGAKLLMLSASGQSSKPEKPSYFPKDVPSNAVQITYEYSSNQKVVRYEWPDDSNPKGRDKTYSQYHIDADGKKVWKKGEARWPAYRIDEVVEVLAAIPDGVPVAVLMLEGEPNVELGRSHSIAGLTLQGSNWSHPEIQNTLETLRATGKNVVLAKLRDNDDTGIKKGQEVWLVARHVQFPCLVIDPRKIYPDIPEKGDIREILEAIGPEEFLARMNAEIAAQAQNPEPLPILTEEVLLTEPRDTGDSKPPSNSKNKQLLDLIENHWGQRLRFNEMTQQIELNGKADLDVERVYLRLADELGVDIPKATATDLVVVIAQKYAYSPVRDYLNSLANVTPIDLNSLAKRHLGTTNSLHAILLKKTLIAGVARIFEPGCKVDTICILYGNQGDYKSMYWQTLASDPFFTDNVSDASEKDEKMKLRRYWMLEYGEFESVYKRKEIAQLKAFLSSRIDSLRVPYGRTIQDFPRTSIFVASTNKQEVLADETGHRRQWIITVQGTIPIETVKAERDAVWAAAVQAYRNGEQWWLTPEEDALLAEANKSHEMSDTWESSILNYLEHKTETTISDILLTKIGLNLAEQKKAEQMRVAEILTRNGWKKAPNAKQIEGKRQKYWSKVVLGGVGVVSEVVSTRNPCPELIVDTMTPPNTTFLKDLQNSIVADENSHSESQESFENKAVSFTLAKSQETFGNEVVSFTPTDRQNPLGEGLQADTTSLTPPPAIGTKHSKTFEVDDEVEITQRSDYQGQRGKIVSSPAYGAREIDYYVKLENETVIVSVPIGADSFAYLKKL